MEKLLDKHHNELRAGGRRFYFMTGDQGTRIKMPSFDSQPDTRSWIPGPMHENTNFTKLANAVCAETLGNGVLTAFGRETAKSQQPIVNATNTHQATEFLRFLGDAIDRERARAYVDELAKHACADCVKPAQLVRNEQLRLELQIRRVTTKTARHDPEAHQTQ